MKTYKFYLNASQYFLNFSNFPKISTGEIEYNTVVATLLSWMCFESYVNALCESLSRGTRLNDHARLFLAEKEMTVDDAGKLNETTIRPSTLKKLLFMIENFSNMDTKQFKQTKQWCDLQAFEDLRNKIAHHKEINNFNIDHKKATECRDLVDEAIKDLNRVFTRVNVPPKK